MEAAAAAVVVEGEMVEGGEGMAHIVSHSETTEDCQHFLWPTSSYFRGRNSPTLIVYVAREREREREREK